MSDIYYANSFLLLNRKEELQLRQIKTGFKLVIISKMKLM